MASGKNVVTGPKAKEKVKMANPTDECFSLIFSGCNSVHLAGLLPIPSGAPSILDKTICNAVFAKSAGGHFSKNLSHTLSAS